MPREEQEAPLKEYLKSKGRGSYQPFESCFSDIFNVGAEIDDGTPSPPEWSIIENKVRRHRRCWSEKIEKTNLVVAKGLHAFSCTHGISARHQDFMPLLLGPGRTVVYWMPMIIAFKGQPFALFIDPRRRRGLTEGGRKFVFSMMHKGIRESKPDYASIGLAIIQFEDVDCDVRRVQWYTDQGVVLFSKDELERMITWTYKLWDKVIEERLRAA